MADAKIIPFEELVAEDLMAKLKESKAIPVNRKPPAFRMKDTPIECPELEWSEEEDWSCEWCNDKNICTWKLGDYGDEEEMPCGFWEDRLGDREYLIPLKADIFNLSEQKIGEVSGWLLNPDMIIADERNAFFAMDGISHLLMCAHHLIIRQKYLFSRTGWLGTIPFVTRLSLFDEFHTLELEREVLDFLLEGYGAIIYSLGYTELDDDDFFDYQGEDWTAYWEEKLWEFGWLRDEHLWYNFCHHHILYEPDSCLFDLFDWD